MRAVLIMLNFLECCDKAIVMIMTLIPRNDGNELSLFFVQYWSIFKGALSRVDMRRI